MNYYQLQSLLRFIQEVNGYVRLSHNTNNIFVKVIIARDELELTVPVIQLYGYAKAVTLVMSSILFQLRDPSSAVQSLRHLSLLLLNMNRAEVETNNYQLKIFVFYLNYE